MRIAKWLIDSKVGSLNELQVEEKREEKCRGLQVMAQNRLSTCLYNYEYRLPFRTVHILFSRMFTFLRPLKKLMTASRASEWEMECKCPTRRQGGIRPNPLGYCVKLFIFMQGDDDAMHGCR